MGLDDSNVTRFVNREHPIDQEESAIGKFDDGRGAVLNYVVVGYDASVLADEEATTLGQNASVAVHHNDRYDASVRRFGDRRYVFSRRLRLRGNRCGNEKNQTKKSYLDCHKPLGPESPLLQFHNLARSSCHYLRYSAVTHDLSRDTNVSVFIFCFGCTKFGAIATPD